MELIAAVEEVDGAGLAVVAAEDANAALVCRGKGVKSASDDCHLLLPAEAVGVNCGSSPLAVVSVLLLFRCSAVV